MVNWVINFLKDSLYQTKEKCQGGRGGDGVGEVGHEGGGVLRGEGDGGDEEECLFPLVEGSFGEVVYAEEGDDGLPLPSAEVGDGVL